MKLRECFSKENVHGLFVSCDGVKLIREYLNERHVSDIVVCDILNTINAYVVMFECEESMWYNLLIELSYNRIEFDVMGRCLSKESAG